MDIVQSLKQTAHRLFDFGLPLSYLRPRAYEKNSYHWHLAQVPEKIKLNRRPVKNPGRWNAIFVVHGMGMQAWSETAVALRSGFEGALEDILGSENEEVRRDPRTIPVPYIHEGFWADYDDLAKSMPAEDRRLGKRERPFFESLWQHQAHSVSRTVLWLLRQQLRLLNPSIIWRISPFAWILYIPLQFASLLFLLAALVRYRKVVSDVLADVRLYADPKGVIERTIVQRIDRRVGEAFLQMIGLDWDFRRLPASKKIHCDHRTVEFDRVTWVAHSLGTVISYNVLSDLFARASEIDKKGTRQQKDGVARFRKSLRRFVTLGSPLDKIAFLFGDKALRPWTLADRLCFWSPNHTSHITNHNWHDWWLNFYHVLDPVSGSLSNRTITCGKPPRNLHMDLLKVPGFAHTAYWSDRTTLRYILGRVYGKEFLPDKDYKPYPSWVLTLAAMVAYVVWLAILVGIIYSLFHFEQVRDWFVKLIIGG